MSNLQNILASGYKSLATETLKQFDIISPDLGDLSSEFLDWLRKYRNSLEKITETGDIKSIGEEDRV